MNRLEQIEQKRWDERRNILDALKKEIETAKKEAETEESSMRSMAKGYYALGLMRAVEVVSDEIIEAERNE